MHPEGTLTFSELLGRIEQIAATLQPLGLTSGTRLAIEAHPSLDIVTLLWAAMARGITVVPLNPRLPQRLFNTYLNYLHCRATYNSSDRFLPKGIILLPKFRNKRISHTQVFPSIPRQIDANLHATIIFTSGSTGQPRAVVHAYRNHYYSALGSNRNIPLQPGDRWMLSLPLYHVAGIAILFRTMLGGASVVLPHPDLSLSENIRQLRPTHLSLVATQLNDLLQEERTVAHLRSMKAILMGGSAIPRNVLATSFREKLPLVLSYGSSEMSSQITATAPGDSWESWCTSGQVLPFRELTINSSGEILVRGATLFLGYWQPQRPKLELNKTGWFATGDIGFWDEKNRLIVQGRKDRMFISGGENIYPEEIERALENTVWVQKAVVVPIADNRFGQRPVAFVQTAPNESWNEEQLKAALRRTLPGFKIPRHIFPWPEEAPGGMKIDLKWFERMAAKKLENR